MGTTVSQMAIGMKSLHRLVETNLYAILKVFALACFTFAFKYRPRRWLSPCAPRKAAIVDSAMVSIKGRISQMGCDRRELIFDRCSAT